MKITIKENAIGPAQYSGRGDIEVEVQSVIYPDGTTWSIQGEDYQLSDTGTGVLKSNLKDLIGQKMSSLNITFE